MKRLRSVIVDDEPLARQYLRELVRSDPRFEVAAECAGGEEAIRVATDLRPDLMLLDVQMPGTDGFDVLVRLTPPLPAIIFVTAFDRYAVRAFDHHALDYVLKPIEEARLRVALARAADRLDGGRRADTPSNLRELVTTLTELGPSNERIVLRTTSSILYLDPGELPVVESSGNYLKVDLDGRTHLVRETLSSLKARLDPARFLQVHRSFLVNLHCVRSARTLPGGSDLALCLRDGREVPVGRTYKNSVVDRLLG